MRGQRDLERVVAASLLCALIALLAPSGVLSLAGAAPLALYLPGYAVVAAIFASRQVDQTKLLVLSVALSLAMLAIGAVLLNYTPGGIRALPWALLLVALIVGGCRMAAVRRPINVAAPRWRVPRLNRAEAGLVFGGLVLAIAAIGLAARALPAREAIGYTELWALPMASESAVRVGIGNAEHNPAAYDLTVKFGNRRAATRSLVLEPGEKKTYRIDAPPSANRAVTPVVATLVRQNRPQRIYRRVKTWLNPQE